jgi:hypothetical protein
MRKLFFVLFLSVIAPVISHSGAAGPADDHQLAILRILDEQTAAWNRGDIEGFMNGYWKSDSLMFIGKSGVTYGWTNTLNNYKKSYPDATAMGKLSFDIITVKRLSKKYCQVVGKWFLKRSIGDLSGHFTLLFEKINSRWVIIADHSS